MAEIRNSAGEIVGGLPEPDPQEGIIRAQNARRLANRRRAATMAMDIARVEGSDLDRHGDPRTPALEGDMNNDGVINQSDVDYIQRSWGGNGAGDLNGDGTIDGQDLALILGRFGETQQGLGGVFEELQDVPDRVVPDRGGLSMEDAMSFLQAFNFNPQSHVLATNSFLSSWGRFNMGLNNP
tara:strand:+ start:1189 stop:1734 length:546 start_codon:yes stop_codon:yes gene_type:complete